jgi:hypothetical protein
MTENAFRRIALGLDGAFESAHMGHPDFRAHGRIFATLRGDGVHGMVSLTPEQQQRFVDDYPDAFAPVNGAWGRGGATSVVLAAADAELVGEAMTLAWQNAAAKAAAGKSKTKKPAKKTTKRRGR